MSTLARGVKRHCAECDTAFYDLQRVPARCPKCGTEVDLKAGKRLVSQPRPPKANTVRGGSRAAAQRPDAEAPAAPAKEDAEEPEDEDEDAEADDESEDDPEHEDDEES